MKFAKLLGKAALLGAGAYVGMFFVYWLNLDNKLIYYGVRPILNKIYDSQERDIRL